MTPIYFFFWSDLRGLLKYLQKMYMIFPLLVHKEAFVGETGVSSGNFLIDSTLGRDTLFGIYVEDEEDHLIKSIRFTDSKGKSYGPFHRMSSDFDLVNFKTINFPAGQSPPFSAVSINFIHKIWCSYNDCGNIYVVYCCVGNSSQWKFTQSTSTRPYTGSFDLHFFCNKKNFFEFTP